MFQDERVEQLEVLVEPWSRNPELIMVKALVKIRMEVSWWGFSEVFKRQEFTMDKASAVITRRVKSFLDTGEKFLPEIEAKPSGQNLEKSTANVLKKEAAPYEK